jgi:hypothetical protein
MQSKLHRGALAALPALLLLGACGTELGAPDAEEQQISLDVAYYVADATSDDIALMTTEADRTMLPAFRTQDGCERLGLFRIRCPQRHFGDNISFTREVTFRDNLGQEMEVFHRDSTESVNIVTTLEGSRSRENLTVTVNRERDMTVSGLFGTETTRTSNGTGSSSVNRTRLSDENGDREYDMTSTTTISNVVHAVPRRGTWPLSGTITRNVTVVVVSGTEDAKTRTRTAVIEFDGTQFATITINGETFTFDLETKTVVRDAEG